MIKKKYENDFIFHGPSQCEIENVKKKSISSDSMIYQYTECGKRDTSKW